VLPRKEQHVYLLHPDSTTSANFIIFLLFINALDVGLPLLASSTDFLADIVIAESRHVSDTDLHVLGFVSTHFWHGTEVAGNLKIITVLVAFWLEAKSLHPEGMFPVAKMSPSFLHAKILAA
jgi:hypothetical protein